MALVKTTNNNNNQKPQQSSRNNGPGCFAQIITSMKQGLPLFCLDNDGAILRLFKVDKTSSFIKHGKYVSFGGTTSHFTTHVPSNNVLLADALTKTVSPVVVTTVYATVWLTVSRTSPVLESTQIDTIEPYLVPHYTYVTSKRNAKRHIGNIKWHLSKPTLALNPGAQYCFSREQVDWIPLGMTMPWNLNNEMMCWYGCADDNALVNLFIKEVAADEEIDTDDLKHVPHCDRFDASSSSQNSQLPQPPRKSSMKQKHKVHYDDDNTPRGDEYDPTMDDTAVLNESISTLTWVWRLSGAVIGRLLQRA